MERIAMSQEERDWLDWLKRARDGKMTQREAAEKTGVSDRWVRALLVELKEKGDAVVVHGLRGQASNRRIDEEIRGRAMAIVKSPDWHDFGPTFAAEQVAKVWLREGQALHVHLRNAKGGYIDPAASFFGTNGQQIGGVGQCSSCPASQIYTADWTAQADGWYFLAISASGLGCLTHSVIFLRDPTMSLSVTF